MPTREIGVSELPASLLKETLARRDPVVAGFQVTVMDREACGARLIGVFKPSMLKAALGRETAEIVTGEPPLLVSVKL